MPLPEERDLYYGLVQYRSRKVRRCPLWIEHGYDYGFEDDVSIYMYAWHYGENFGFVPDTTGMFTVVERRLVEPLRRSGLTGINLMPLPVEEGCPEREKFDLHYLRLGGRDCLRNLKVHEPDPNECPFCGYGPVICPECGNKMNICYRCRKQVVADDGTKPGEEGLQWLIPPLPVPRRTIIDLKYWDGRDVFQGMGHEMTLVTRRVVDFLLEVHAGPFMAEPLLADVRECSDEILRQMERARKR